MNAEVKRILIVDDDPKDVEFASLHLKKINLLTKLLLQKTEKRH